MKKTYIQPSLTVQRVEITQMLMTSTVSVSGNSYEEDNLIDLTRDPNDLWKELAGDLPFGI